jgi:carboxyl-terminal processing protease
MKNKVLPIVLVGVLAALNTAQAAADPPQLAPLPQETQAAHLAAGILSRYHYRHVALDGGLSAQIFDNYLKMLDGEKLFFLRTDIERYTDARTKLGEAIRHEDLSIPFALFNLYQQRVGERITYARSLLKQGFDFKAEESYQLSRKDAPWPKSVGELNDLWRKRVKNDWLRLKLAGKDEKSIAATLDKRYQNAVNNQSRIKSEDAFQTFMSAYATAMDPHTDYFGVRASEEFDISMRLSLMGIGAVLTEKDEYTTIRELVVGGPAALSGKLKPGDRIVGIAQGDGPMVDIVGWRLDDAVALIRGPEGTVVNLDILPPEAGADSKHRLVSLVRKKVSLDKMAASKSIIEVKDGAVARRIGVITLPEFYEDFAARQRGDKDFRSASRDVARLLEELKQERVDGVLVDLRNNGGGSLNEAIELTGLFIDQGPVVQQRDSEGKVRVERDTHPGAAWDGPLGVLINRGSASASEIFTAAIQDYGRGVVIGEPSFGKGTVQTVVNLDEIAKNGQPRFGELKMTIAQFFRINGGTTQLRGVTPDIGLPATIDASEFGESSYDNALPWMQITPAEYAAAGDLTGIVPLLNASHEKRIKQDADFRYLQEDLAEFVQLRRKNLISLNEADRRNQREVQEARERSREEASDHKLLSRATRDDGMLASERNLNAQLAIEKESKSAKDIFLTEAAHVVSDEVGLTGRPRR